MLKLWKILSFNEPWTAEKAATKKVVSFIFYQNEIWKTCGLVVFLYADVEQLHSVVYYINYKLQM